MGYLVPSEEFPDPRAAPDRVSFSFNDGNGMWISTGVSPDLSTDLTEGVPRRAIPQTPESHGTEPEWLEDAVQPDSSRSTGDRQRDQSGGPLYSPRREWRSKALMSGEILPIASMIALTRPGGDQS